MCYLLVRGLLIVITFGLGSTVLLSQSNSNRGILLQDLTWLEAERMLTPDTVVVIPLGAAAKDCYQSGSIQLQLHPGLRHVVPVNRQTRAGEITTAGETHTMAIWKLAEFPFPTRRLKVFRVLKKKRR